MRGLILGVVIVMAVPTYAVGQRRDGSGRSATGRTAVPREEAVQAPSATQAERRGETLTPSARDEKSDDTAQSRAGRERRSTSSGAGAVRGLNPGFLSPLNPGFVSSLNPGFRPVLDREQRRPPHRRPHSGANVVFVPYAAPVFFEREVVVEREVVDEAARVPVIVEPPSLSRLVLDIYPPTAQVFADGYYIGVPEDFRFEDRGAVLEPGPHRIEILARDHEPVSFDVSLARGQSATFRHSLRPIMRAPQPAPDDAVKAPTAVRHPATFYLIPGCYIGNVPPKEANLPATCDVARAVTFQY